MEDVQDIAKALSTPSGSAISEARQVLLPSVILQAAYLVGWALVLYFLLYLVNSVVGPFLFGHRRPPFYGRKGHPPPLGVRHGHHQHGLPLVGVDRVSLDSEEGQELSQKVAEAVQI